MPKIFRRSFSTTVTCDCGYRQSTNTDAQADVMARTHTCPPPTPRRRNAGR